jgi:hypothetical protein
MLQVTTEVDCDSCGRTVELEWEELPDHSNIVSNLGRLGWTTEKGHICPECSKGEDALLIAAAPEMLELLVRISAKEAFIGLPDSLQEEVFAVIAKASGEEELS